MVFEGLDLRVVGFSVFFYSFLDHRGLDMC